MAETGLKYLIFSVAYLPFVGGAELAVKEITDRLPELQFDLITVNLNGQEPPEERLGRVNVYRVGRGRWGKYLFPILGAWKGYRLHRKKPYDGVWAIMAAYAGFAALVFSYLAPRAHFVLTLQEGDPFEHIKKKVSWIFPLFKRIFTRAHAIQAISHYLAQFGREMGHRKEIAVIPNGVDLKLFGAYFSEREIAALRESLQLPANRSYLVTTSRLVVKNGLADVIRALPQLPPELEFIIIGSGPEEENLRNLSQTLQVSGRVHFLGQRLYAELPLFLHLGKVFIRPSLSEGMGNSFVEAMAAGLPVVGTPVGGIVDFLRSGETGWLCEPGRPESIVPVINYLLDYDNRVAVSEVVNRARQLAYTYYGWDEIARQMREVLIAA
jgi:glycosyltransferase involved in cell wall biosynthesis